MKPTLQDRLLLYKFEKALAGLVEQFKAGEIAHSNVEICVRHFVHPDNYHLGKEMQRMAAEAMGESLDEDGMWPCCWGELWWYDVLSTPQVGGTREEEVR